MASSGDIELQRDTTALGRDRAQSSTIKNDENEAAGYGDTSTKIWKLYGIESERHDKALVDSWKSNTDSMLIFTGLFSSIVASFLIETYKTLTPASGSSSQSAPSSAVRVNIFLFLSLFFSVTSALASTLIQQWAREYLQYSQPSAAPHKRGRVRAYLFDGLSKFQMRRVTYGVPVLLHLAVFLFFYAISEWLHSINVPVGTTARYCLVALLAIYLALSVLPLIVQNAPYQTALTTPLQACISLIRFSYIVLRRLGRRTSAFYQAHKGSGLFKAIHVNRARALMIEIQKKAPKLDRFAMHWLLQELDEDDMDIFLGGLPGYLHSPLTNKKLAVEGLMQDGVPGRIREHITTCLRSVELSQEESISRTSTCINSLRLISETASETAISRPSSENDEIQGVMEYLEPLCYDSSIALRASCVRGLVIREFLIPLVDMDPRKSQTKFPDFLIPLHKVISAWKMTEIAQWSHITGVLTATSHPLPTDSEQLQKDMWQDVYDGPLINLAVLAYTVLSRADEGDVNFDMAWKTLETLLKSFGLAQIRASPLARARFEEVLHKAHDGVSGFDGGVTQIGPLFKTMDIVLRGLRLAEVFAYTSKPTLSRKQIEAIFGPDQLRNTELLVVFAAHLPGYVTASTPEISREFIERLILKDELWQQLHSSFVKFFKREVPFPDKLRILVAFLKIFEVAFDVLRESTVNDWLSQELDLLFGQFSEFEMRVAPGESVNKGVDFLSILFRGQFCHALLSQFALRRIRGEPFKVEVLPSLVRLVGLLGVGTQEDMDSLTPGHRKAARTGFDMMIKAAGILDLTLRDGPLSNFCIYARLAFDTMSSDVSDLTPDNTKRLWTLLERMVYTPAAPFANSSGAAWARFDHLCAVVRDPALSGINSQTMERLRPLFDMIEEVERKRPPADERAEGTGNVDNQIRPDGSAGLETLRFGRPRIPRLRRLVRTSHMGQGGPAATSFSPFPGTIPLAEVHRRGQTSHSPSDLGLVTIDDPTSSTPIALPGGPAELDTPQLGVARIPGPNSQGDAWHPGIGGYMDPRLSASVQASISTDGMDPFAPRGWTHGGPSDFEPAMPGAPPTSVLPTTQAGPHIPQIHPLASSPTYMPSLSGPQRAFTSDTANLPVQAHTQSVVTDIQHPPGHMLADPSPYSSSSLGPFDVPQVGHGNQGGNQSGRVPVICAGGPQTPDPNPRATDPGGE